MASLDWNGTDGLPPLDDDDNNRRFWRDLLAPLRSWPPSMSGMSGKWRLPLGGTRKCATEGCAHLAEPHLPFCAVCNLRQLQAMYSDSPEAQRLLDAVYNDDPVWPTLPDWPDHAPEIVALPEPRTPATPQPGGWPRTSGAPSLTPLDDRDHPTFTLLDDQCRYCRAILIEMGEPLHALSASAQFARYMCPRHIQRNVALALTLDRIDDLMRTTPTRRGLTSAEVARTVDAAGGGYLMLSDN